MEFHLGNKEIHKLKCGGGWGGGRYCKHLPIIIDLEMSFKNIIAMTGNHFMLKVNLFSVFFMAFKKADWFFVSGLKGN